MYNKRAEQFTYILYIYYNCDRGISAVDNRVQGLPLATTHPAIGNTNGRPVNSQAIDGYVHPFLTGFVVFAVTALIAPTSSPQPGSPSSRCIRAQPE
jgi:hypothetical protein